MAVFFQGGFDAITYTLVGLPETVGVLVGTAVERNTQVNLGSSRAVLDIPVQGIVGIDTSALSVINVRLVIDVGEPRAGIVVGLQSGKVSESYSDGMR